MKLDQHEKLFQMMILTVRDSEERSLPFAFFSTRAIKRAHVFPETRTDADPRLYTFLGPPFNTKCVGVSLSLSALPSAIRVFGGFSLKLYFFLSKYRSPNRTAMDRYQRVEKPKPESPINENEIRITTQGVIRNYISYATTLLQVIFVSVLSPCIWLASPSSSSSSSSPCSSVNPLG